MNVRGVRGVTALVAACLLAGLGVSLAGAALWKHIGADTVALATAPFFHVTGLIHSFLATVYAGGTMVIQRRWDPLQAAELVARHRCTHWDNVPTMVVDLLSHPRALEHDLASLQWIFGGGAAMPEAIAQKLFEVCGVRYIEGYGMTETISQTHINPPQNPKKQCLGIPTFDTEALVVDPQTLEILGASTLEIADNNDTGVRHLRVKVDKKGSKFASLIDRLSGKK